MGISGLIVFKAPTPELQWAIKSVFAPQCTAHRYQILDYQARVPVVSERLRALSKEADKTFLGACRKHGEENFSMVASLFNRSGYSAMYCDDPSGADGIEARIRVLIELGASLVQATFETDEAADYLRLKNGDIVSRGGERDSEELRQASAWWHSTLPGVRFDVEEEVPPLEVNGCVVSLIGALEEGDGDALVHLLEERGARVERQVGLGSQLVIEGWDAPDAQFDVADRRLLEVVDQFDALTRLGHYYEEDEG